MRIPTVFINRGGVKVMINASDYRLGSDTLWSDKPALKNAPKKVTKKKAAKKVANQ